MLRSKSTKISILFLGMLFCHLVVPNFIASFLEGTTYYTALLLAQLLLQFPVVIYLVVTQTNPLKLISFKLFHPGAALLIILMTYCVLPLTSLVNLISMLFVENALTDMSGMMVESNFWLNLLFIAVIPALSEEFAFRGVFFHTLKKQGLWFGVAASALFFGMMHLNFNQFSYTFVIGMLMALAVLATGSIWGGVLVHFTLNANSVLLMTGMEKLTEFFGDMQGGTSDILEQAETVTLSSGELLTSMLLIGVVAVIMLIPAGCFLYAIAHICGNKGVLGPMFFPRKYERDASRPASQDDQKQNRILDIFFILCLLITFGYMLYLAVF